MDRSDKIAEKLRIDGLSYSDAYQVADHVLDYVNSISVNDGVLSFWGRVDLLEITVSIRDERTGEVFDMDDFYLDTCFSGRFYKPDNDFIVDHVHVNDSRRVYEQRDEKGRLVDFGIESFEISLKQALSDLQSSAHEAGPHYTVLEDEESLIDRLKDAVKDHLDEEGSEGVLLMCEQPDDDMD